ncbi:MAG: response regulator YycF [Clostridia bacterium]
MSKKILIVDDEKPIVEILKFNLEKEGYEIIEAYDGEEAMELAKTKSPDLMILDVMLPKIDGFTVCKKLRQDYNFPIIMLTAKEDIVDKIIGLELGADDYITKPFSVRELMARVKANLRKFSVPDKEQVVENDKIIKIKNMIIDLERYMVCIEDKQYDLTIKEFDLMKFLAKHRGQVFSREQILENVWGYDYFGDLRTVDVTIRRIREKIEKDSSRPEYIITKRGIGYYIIEK